MLLLLVRHALTPMTGKKLSGRLPGIDLSREGVRQAESLAERLAGFPIDLIYSSPIERCMQTAAAIAAKHSKKVVTDPRLSEIAYGQWQGKSLKVLYRTKDWARLKAHPADFRFPGGETIREAQVRGMAAVEELRDKHRGKVVMACSHADLIRVVVAGYLGLSLDLYDRISIAPASVSAIWLAGSTPRVLRLSETGSIDELAKRIEKARSEAAR